LPLLGSEFLQQRTNSSETSPSARSGELLRRRLVRKRQVYQRPRSGIRVQLCSSTRKSVCPCSPEGKATKHLRICRVLERGLQFRRSHHVVDWKTGHGRVLRNFSQHLRVQQG